MSTPIYTISPITGTITAINIAKKPVLSIWADKVSATKPVITFYDDGTIYVEPSLTADQAAEEFLASLGRNYMLNYNIGKDVMAEHNNAVDKAIERLNTYHDSTLEFQIVGKSLISKLVNELQLLKRF